MADAKKNDVNVQNADLVASQPNLFKQRERGHEL
jgi:hypothetical protein